MRLFALALLALPLLSAEVLAESFSVTIENGSSSELTRFSVSGGKVQGFRPVGANAKRSVEVILDDGVCEAEIRLGFADDGTIDTMFDFCSNDTIQASDSY